MNRVTRLLVLCALLLPEVGLAQNPGPNSTSSIFTLPNASSTGTTQNYLAKIDANGNAVKAGTSDTSVKLYVVVAGAGTTGNARLVLTGYTSCVFDATNASGIGAYYVVASTSVAGQCHAQAAPPANGMVIGMMAQQSTTNGQAAKIIAENTAYVPGSGGAGSGTVQNGVVPSIACYAATTEVNDCVPAGSNNLYVKWSGGSPTNSTLAAAGVGACTNQAVTGLNADAAPTCTTLTSAYVNTTIALTGTDIDTSSRVTGASTSFALKGDNTPTTLSGDVNDYTAGGTLCTNAVQHINGGAADRNITGLGACSDGLIVVIHNSGTTNAIVLKNLSSSSSAANRLLLTPGQTTAGDVTLNPGDAFALMYDATGGTTQWRPVSNAIPDKYKIKSFIIPFGSKASDAPPLVADDDLPGILTNDYLRPFKVLAVACYADAGTLTITPILTGGSATSILSSACTCGSATYSACTVNGTPTLNPYASNGATCSSTPCSADVNLTTVDGTVKYGIVKVVGILQ